MAVVLVDAENVRRSRWPNLSREELVRRSGNWAEAEGHQLVVVFDGPAPDVEPGARVELVGTKGETADDRLQRLAADLVEQDEPYWLVTSDRALRTLAGRRAERTIGGGSFLRQLLEG